MKPYSLGMEDRSDKAARSKVVSLGWTKRVSLADGDHI